MIVQIELLVGHNHDEPTKRDINKNIHALERAINNKQRGGDFVLLSDTKSILEGIKEKLPD